MLLVVDKIMVLLELRTLPGGVGDDMVARKGKGGDCAPSRDRHKLKEQYREGGVVFTREPKKIVR